MRKVYLLISLLTGLFVFQASSCGSSTTTTTTTSTLVGQWAGQNSTNKCLPATDACYSTKFTVTFTADKSYSIASDDGGAVTGTYTYTPTTLTTVVSPLTSSSGSGCKIDFTGVGGAITAPTVSLADGGSGYTVGQVLSVAGGTGGLVSVATISSGAALTVTLVAGGSGYAVGAVTNASTSMLNFKTSACLTKDFLDGVTYTLSSDGKTMTIPVCPITLTKQ